MKVFSILIVDDEPVIRQGLEVLIQASAQPFVVRGQAGTGKKALDLMTREHFDLVITDIEMPDMNGLDFIECCRQRDFSSRFVILTGFDKFDYARKACHCHVSEYLLKPVSTEELYRVLAQTAEQLQEDHSEKELWKLFFAGKDRKSSFPGLDRKYREVTGWYFILIQFNEAVSSEELPSGYLYLDEASFLRKGVLLHESDDAGTINDQVFALHRDLNINGKKLVLFLGSRVHRYWDLKQSRDQAVSLFPLFYYRNWNTLIHAGEETEFSSDESVISQHLDYIKKLCLAGTLSDNEFDSLYRDILKIRTDPGICRLKIQQLLFSLFPYLSEWGIVKKELLERHFLLFSRQGEISWQDTIMLLRDFFNDIRTKQQDFRKSGSSAIIDEIVLSIKKDFVSDLKLPEIAGKYKMNKAYLGQLFKKNTGETFHEYLNRIRIEEACRLLIHSDMKVYQVAYQVGFKDPSYFMSRFEKKVGITPRVYRRNRLQHAIGVSQEPAYSE